MKLTLGGWRAVPRAPDVLGARRPLRILSLLWCLCLLWPVVNTDHVHAQRADSIRAGVVVPPPLTPRRAFFYSLAVPGLAQAKLGRPLVGAGFFLVEALAIGVLHRTTDDLRLARAYQRDSVPLRYAVDAATGVAQVDANGLPVVAAWAPSYYARELTRSRRLQVEDWSAILVFNHLIAGAEAFVAAQLWDLPDHVKLRATPVRGGGFGLQATLTAPSRR